MASRASRSLSTWLPSISCDISWTDPTHDQPVALFEVTYTLVVAVEAFRVTIHPMDHVPCRLAPTP